MFAMREHEWQGFILRGSRAGKLVTVKPNGDPHVVSAWFLADGESISFSSGEKTAKIKHVAQHPRATLCIGEEKFPCALATLERDAQIEKLSPPELQAYTVRLGARYVGEDRALEFRRRNAIEDDMPIRLNPIKVIPWGGMSD
ncbi:MAG: pyridoxamine 5'-phosphate oxidase family protein [Gammaproteobacteria bacterium]